MYSKQYSLISFCDSSGVNTFILRVADVWSVGKKKYIFSHNFMTKSKKKKKWDKKGNKYTACLTSSSILRFTLWISDWATCNWM